MDNHSDAKAWGVINFKIILDNFVFYIVYLRYTIEWGMAKAKISEFQESEVELAELAKAIAHPARIRILNILTECDTCITGSIIDQLPLTVNSFSAFG